MLGGQARMSGSPPQRRSRRWAHSRLTACPATAPAGHWRWPVVGRAFGACCFAGKLRSPAPPTGKPRSPGPLVAGDPYVIPYALGCVPPPSMVRVICPAQCPFGGQSAAINRG
jgi:hypothetical protein